MEVQRDEMTAGADRLRGLFGWWGAQGNRAMEGRIEKFQQLTNGLHKAYGEAFDALTAPNDRVSRSFQGLFSIRTPDELLVAQTEIMTSFMEAASLQMKAWSEISRKIQACYTDVACETASDIGNQTREVVSTVQETVQEVTQDSQRRARRAAKESA
jgi:hypothetical protein